MPTLQINGASLYYEIHGHGPEVMLFSHGLLFSGKMFKNQVDYFKARYKCVVYDHRGQGRSEVTENGYGMDSVYEDAVALIRELNLGPCHMVGLSMGGFVAMRIAARNPELLKSLILLETSAETEPNKFKYNLLKTITQVLGVSSVINKVMPIVFGKSFLHDQGRKDLVQQWKNELLTNKKTIARAVKGVIDREGVMHELDNIYIPTLIIVGDEDVATPPEKSKNIKLKIPQARLAIIKKAGHSSVIEEPIQVIETIDVFLNGVH
jgi:pimeloyl-ACP methyl ester carboxylesterase